MVSVFRTIYRSGLWEKFHDLFVVIGIMLILLALYVIGLNTYGAWWTLFKHPPDISYKLSEKIIDMLTSMSHWAICLSLVTTVLAVIFAATNDRLSFPIRLLAAAENTNKFVYALFYSLNCFCDLNMRQFQCVDDLWTTIIYVNSFLGTYSLQNIAQFCQLLISLSRFLVFSFGGQYFKYTLKFPILQLIFPYALGIGLKYLSDWLNDQFAYYNACNDLLTIPFFMMCGLDYVTYRNMKQYNRHVRTSRAESLLMIQMIANSCMNLTNTVGLYLGMAILNLFVGNNLMSVFYYLLTFNQAFLFNLLASFISVLCFRKPSEKRQQNGRTLNVTVSSIDMARIG